MQLAAVVHLAPFINDWVVPIVAPVLALLAVALVTRVMSLLHVPINDQSRAVVQGAINSGIALLQAKLKTVPIDVNAPDHIAAVANYVTTTVPGALAKIGVTPDQLAAKVQAELAKVINP